MRQGLLPRLHRWASGQAVASQELPEPALLDTPKRPIYGSGVSIDGGRAVAC